MANVGKQNVESEQNVQNSDEIFETFAYWFLSESSPVCSSNISNLSLANASDCSEQSHFTAFSCQVKYAGNTPPRLTVQRVTGDDIVDITNITGTTSGNLITAEVLLQINSSWNGSYLICLVSATEAPNSSVTVDQSIRRNVVIRSAKFRCQSNEIHIPCVHSKCCCHIDKQIWPITSLHLRWIKSTIHLVRGGYYPQCISTSFGVDDIQYPTMASHSCLHINVIWNNSNNEHRTYDIENNFTDSRWADGNRFDQFICFVLIMFQWNED